MSRVMCAERMLSRVGFALLLLTTAAEAQSIAPFCTAPIPADWGYCICTNRAANDMMFSNFAVSPANPGRGDNVIFTYTSTIDMNWAFNDPYAGVATTLYVDGTPRTRKTFTINAPQFSGLSAGNVGPGVISGWSLNTGQWGEIGGSQLFFEQIFYAPYSGDTLLCIRTKAVNPS